MPGAARAARHDCQLGKKSVFRLLAGLVGNAAAGLAGALAGGLAFTAAAVLQALRHVAGLQGLNVLHITVTPLHNYGLFLLYTYPA